MTKPNKVFLTDTRRRYLNDPDSFTDTNRRAHFYRMRNRAQMALDELIEVYESDVIDNSELFEPEDVYRLFEAVFPDPDNLPSRDEYDGGEVEWAEEHAYEHALLNALQTTELKWRLLLLGSENQTTNLYLDYLSEIDQKFIEEYNLD